MSVLSEDRCFYLFSGVFIFDKVKLDKRSRFFFCFCFFFLLCVTKIKGKTILNNVILDDRFSGIQVLIAVSYSILSVSYKNYKRIATLLQHIPCITNIIPLKNKQIQIKQSLPRS